jgi:hypothetical protein
MKSNTIKLFIICISLVCLTSIEISKIASAIRSSSPTDVSVKRLSNTEVQWQRLFNRPGRTLVECDQKGPQAERDILKLEEEKKLNKKIKYGGALVGPKAAQDQYTKVLHGWGQSSYFFDYLDPVLRDEVVREFKRIWDEAIKIAVPDQKKDPYSLENMLQEEGTESDLLRKVERLNPSFSAKVWKNSISVSQMNYILDNWKWQEDKNSPNPAKSWVDRFDFNGDGRLSPKEFVLSIFIGNKQILGTQDCQNCLYGLIRNKLFPIYMYIDCNADEKVTSVNIWNALVNIKRPARNAYNFYQCELNRGKVRTSAVNDFINKAMVSMDSALNKDEFMFGLLFGFWARQVDNEAVHLGDAKNLKDKRWNEDGSVDKICLHITERAS